MPTSDVLVFWKVHIIQEGCRPQARMLYRKFMSYRPNTNVPECLQLNPSPLCTPFPRRMRNRYYKNNTEGSYAISEYININGMT